MDADEADAGASCCIAEAEDTAATGAGSEGAEPDKVELDGGAAFGAAALGPVAPGVVPLGVAELGVAELIDELRPESISRFKRFRSPRSSDATW